VVKLEHIGKRYGSSAPILADISLDLEPGGFYFLTGASGAGKTTLLNIITLAEQPSQGRVMLFGRDTGPLDRAARAAMRRRIGIVFQDFRLIDELSAADNVALPLRIAGVAERQVGDNVPELLNWVGLAGRGDAIAASLSGGERQRVAIARAVIGRPSLLVADEPTGNVDDDVAMLLVRAFERINRLGTTVLIATHDFAFARQFEHQHLQLDHGRLAIAEAAQHWGIMTGAS
jgi:cell division transport system ATP-binding protein